MLVIPASQHINLSYMAIRCKEREQGFLLYTTRNLQHGTLSIAAGNSHGYGVLQAFRLYLAYLPEVANNILLQTGLSKFPPKFAQLVWYIQCGFKYVSYELSIRS